MHWEISQLLILVALVVGNVYSISQCLEVLFNLLVDTGAALVKAFSVQRCN